MNLDDLIRSADPAREVPPPAGTSATAQWTYAQITRAQIKLPRRYPRLRLVFPAAMVLGLVLVVADVLVVTTHPPTSASTTLRRAAMTVSERSLPAPGLGQSLYTETKSLYQVTVYQRESGSTALMAVAHAQYLETEQAWADSDGRGRGRVEPRPPAIHVDRRPGGLERHPFGSALLVPLPADSGRALVTPAGTGRLGLSTKPPSLSRELAQGLGATDVDLIRAGPSAVFQRAAGSWWGPRRP